MVWSTVLLPTTMSPILSSIAAAPISPPRPVSLARPLSSSSIQSFATSLRLVDVVADSIRVEGLRHARVTLKARYVLLPTSLAVLISFPSESTNCLISFQMCLRYFGYWISDTLLET